MGTDDGTEATSGEAAKELVHETSPIDLHRCELMFVYEEEGSSGIRGANPIGKGDG